MGPFFFSEGEGGFESVLYMTMFQENPKEFSVFWTFLAEIAPIILNI